MAKFRPSKKDVLKYQNLKKRANAKLKRTKKDGIDFSSEINVPNSLSDIGSRKEFNDFIERTEFFLIPNNSHYKVVKNKFGVVSTAYEISREKVRTKIAQRRADDQIKKVVDKVIFDDGKPSAMTVGQRMAQMGKPSVAGFVRPMDFDFESYQTQDGLEGRFRSTEGRSQPDYHDRRNSNLKDNFNYVLSEAFNSDANELIEKLKELSNDDFLMLFIQTEEFDFELFYQSENGVITPPEELTPQKMLNFVDAFLNGDYDKDFKNI